MEKLKNLPVTQIPTEEPADKTVENWQDIYQSKLCPPGEALKAVKSGDRVVLGHACGEPQKLASELAKRTDLKDVKIYHMVAFGKCEYAAPELKDSFEHVSLFVGPGSRQAVKEKRVTYLPCYLSQMPRLYQERIIPVDVALIQVSPMDSEGNFSFGVSVDYTKPAAESAKIVIAQVNKNMPRTLGDCFINVKNIDRIVEYDEDLIELPPPKIGEVEEKIAANIEKYIEDGSVLQLGIGALPDALLRFLQHKKDLSIHTETFCDGVKDLIASGALTHNKKVSPGKIVACMIFGTKKLYQFVNNNPLFEMHPVDFTNDPRIISQNDKVVSINAAIEVDLMGQVNAETIGGVQYSGVGGQVDFVRGAAMSKGGKSFIVLPATAKGGTISRIVPCLEPGSALTTSRNDVHFVATEYGVVDLRGKNLRERAGLLAGIAHPEFRGGLEEYIRDNY